MAPELSSLNTIDDLLKDIIQTLYAIQSSVHAYQGPDTHQELIRKIKQLTSQLSALTLSSSSQSNTSSPILIPPEIIAYVDEGRNPDIYTREFVELVQRGNVYLHGKSDGLKALRDELAKEMCGEAGWGEGMREQVDAAIGKSEVRG